MRLSLLVALLFLPTAAVAQDLVAKTDALSPADEAKKFKLPPGFTAQLVASEPDIQKPMQMAFDAKGRLWLTTSYLYPFAAAVGKGSDKLFVLSDFAANGKANKVEVFDDKLNIPIGVLPLPDGKSVIVSEIGKILKLTDTDGDGKADKRENLFTGFGYRDTHGMYNSFTPMPDGWVYACHGYLNDSTVKGKDGHEVKMNSGNTFRFKPDGSRIEVFTRGQVNPFGITVDPWLNVYTADCHSKPVTQLIRGAHYDSFGKPHDGLGYAPHVYNHLHDSTGLCGLAYYAADHFPKEWTGVMFVGNVVTSRINCDRIEWKGSTPAGKELPDFLVSDDPWFRPVDIKLGPDGALYVCDFYNKIIGHYEVDLKHPGRDKGRGRLWRIVWTGTDPKALVAPPTFPRKDWTQASNDELLSDFGHPNTSVRLLAANEAASRASFKPAGEKVLDDRERLSFRMGLYALVQERTGEIDLNGYDTAIEFAKKNPDKMPPEHLSGLVVRAMVSRKEWGPKERELALDCFKSFDSVRVKRAVIDGMTAHPHADFVEPLLDFVPTVPADDTHLRHAAKVALRNCLDTDTTGTAWKRTGKVFASAILPSALGSTSPVNVTGLVTLFGRPNVPDALLAEVGYRVGRYGTDADRKALADFVMDRPYHSKSVASLQALVGLARGLQEAGWKPSTDDGKTVVSRALAAAQSALGESTPGLADAGVQVHREMRKVCDPRTAIDRFDGLYGLVHLIVREKRLRHEQRAAAAEVLLLHRLDEHRTCVGEYLAEPNTPPAVRERLLLAALAAEPRPTERAAALEALKTAAYAGARTLAVGLAGSKAGADDLLAAVKAGLAPARLLQEKAVVDRLTATKVPDLAAKLKELTKDLPAAEKRLDDLIKARAAGYPKATTDVAKGKEVFTKHCAVCHQLNSDGAKVGPQLDGVGIRGVERLLEDTLDPNRNVDHAFRATKLDLKDGRALTGLLLREEGAVYVLADNVGKEQRVNKADVDAKTTANTSAMPANLDTTMTEAEYYHLLRFLLEQKAKK
jgi:putative heme-binding domain-containing protein